jgi:hypothetical protein
MRTIGAVAVTLLLAFSVSLVRTEASPPPREDNLLKAYTWGGIRWDVDAMTKIQVSHREGVWTLTNTRDIKDGVRVVFPSADMRYDCVSLDVKVSDGATCTPFICPPNMNEDCFYTASLPTGKWVRVEILRVGPEKSSRYVFKVDGAAVAGKVNGDVARVTVPGILLGSKGTVEIKGYTQDVKPEPVKPRGGQSDDPKR